MESEPGKPPKGRPKRGFWGVIQWIFLWGTIFGLTGVALVAMTNKAVIWSSSDSFCGTLCPTMTWSSAAHHQGPHFINASGVRASCGQCHIPYDSSHATATEYVKLLLFKTDRGAKDFWYESRKTIATKEEWEKQRPQLRTEFENYTKAHNYITCRGCHSLEAFGGPRSRMKALIHKDLIKANTFDCFQCHQDVGHVYERRRRRLAAGTQLNKRLRAQTFIRHSARAATVRNWRAALGHLSWALRGTRCMEAQDY